MWMLDVQWDMNWTISKLLHKATVKDGKNLLIPDII